MVWFSARRRAPARSGATRSPKYRQARADGRLAEFFRPLRAAAARPRRPWVIVAGPGRSRSSSNSRHHFPWEERVDAAVSDELEQIWSRVQTELARAVDESTYRTWLEGLHARELAGARLLVEAPPGACGWIRDRFGRVIQSCATTVIGADVTLELIGENPKQDRGRTSAFNPAQPSYEGSHRDDRSRCAPGASAATHSHPFEPQDGLRTGALRNPKLSFDQFVIGDSNRLAHAAALTGAEMP